MSIFAAAPIDVGDITGVGVFMSKIDSNTKAATTISGGFISILFSTITTVAGLAFMLFFVMGGLKWITAGGDKSKVQEAQSSMTQAAIGLIVVVVSLFVVGIVGGVLGVDLLNPVKVIINLTRP